MLTQEQLDSFYQFASAQLEQGGTELSIDEVYELWRAKQLTPEELAESVAALRAAYADLEAGEVPRPAREVLRESCKRLGIAIDDL